MRRQHAEIRVDERRPFRCPVQVSWQTRAAGPRTISAKCVDLSPQGARLECAEAIDVRTNVYLQAPDHGLLGNATVRYCVRKGLKYDVGLLFSSVASQADQGRKRILDARKGRSS